MQEKLFFKFTSSMSLYYTSYAVIMGYATLFMQAKGFNNTQIGIFFACSSVLCILLQIFTGSFLDSHPQFSVKLLVLTSATIVIISALLLSFASQKWVIFICYILIGAWLLADSSLYNSFGMEYINADMELNYSLSRGLCSLLYAGTSLIMGLVIKHFSVMIILPVFLFLQGTMIITLFFLKPAKEKVSPEIKKEHQKKEESFFCFLKRNPVIFLLLISILFVYISHTSVSNFHINIIKSVGGTSRELGISSSLSALLELPAMALFLPLSKKISYRNILCISCTFFFLKITCMFFAGSIIQVYLTQCLQFFSYGLFIPASAYFMNSILPVQDKTKGQAALGIFTFGLSGLLSSLLSGIMLDHFSVKTMLGFESCLVFTGLIGVLFSCHMLKKNTD